MTHCPSPRPVPCASKGSPPRGTCLGDTLAPPQGTPPRLAPHRIRTVRPCLPDPPRPPQRRNTGPFEDAELRALYGIHATAPLGELVPALWAHLQDVDLSRLFAVVPPPHAATAELFVRQLIWLFNPGTQITEDLVDGWIWWFNTHRPDHGGTWVPQLGWAHTLTASPTDPRPAPSAGGQERAAPPPRAETLRIPPYEGLAEWESRTARDRGRNLTSMVERYPETARAAPPPRERDPSTIGMIVLESGHYYQVRITPHPQESHWSLEGVDSMLPANTALSHNPSPLPNGQPPDPLTAIVSGAAGTWHPGHALYCLWRWARRGWPQTGDWTATWSFHLDGRQQLEAIPQRERTAETPTRLILPGTKWPKPGFYPNG